MRVRRVALVAVLAVLAGSSLAGCRSEPAVAAYLGDRKVMIDEVNAIVDEVNDVADARTALIARVQAEQVDFFNSGKPAADQPAIPDDANLPVSRTNAREVLSLIVCADLGHDLIAEQGLDTSGAPPAEVFAGHFGLPASDRYIQLWFEYWQAYMALTAKSHPQPITDDQAQRLYDAIAATGQQPDLNTLKSNPNLGAVFQTQQAFNDALHRSGALLNPRYGQLVLPLAADNSNISIDLPFPDVS